MYKVALWSFVVAAVVAVQVIPQYLDDRERAAAAEVQRAAVRAKLAADTARAAAENDPDAIEQRRHEAQIAALEAADLADREKAARDAAEAACRRDAQCWYTRHVVDADSSCQEAIEKLAQYQYEWTNGIFSKPRFERVGWADRDTRTILLIGSAIKMQNGFGAWRNMDYQCTFSTDTGVAIASAE